MEPRAELLRDLALFDPVAAYGIFLGIPRVPISMNATAIFSSFQLGQIVEGDLDTTIAQRTWIDNIAYSIQVPNMFSGNVFKTQYDAYLKLAPGLSVRLTVHSGPKYLVSPQFTPLENFANLIGAARWTMGWPLYKQQSIKVEYLLTQAPSGPEPNGPPLSVTTSFNGWQFLDYTIDEIDPRVAADNLRKAGFDIPLTSCS